MQKGVRRRECVEDESTRTEFEISVVCPHAQIREVKRVVDNDSAVDLQVQESTAKCVRRNGCAVSRGAHRSALQGCTHDKWAQRVRCEQKRDVSK